MADFCLKCFNELNNSHYEKEDVIEEFGICEGCGEYKDCVVDLRGYGLIDNIVRLYIRLFKRNKAEAAHDSETLDF